MAKQKYTVRPKSVYEVFQLFVFLGICVVLFLCMYQFDGEVELDTRNGRLSGWHTISYFSLSSRRQELPQTYAIGYNSSLFAKNPKQNSKFAYVTLMSGIDEDYKYRGFLYNSLIMKRALKEAGSTADFIVLVGYRDDANTAPFESDLNLLRSHGIITYILPRLVHKSLKLSFAEMALLKITPWNFTEYERIQFFDGDIMPLKNMDCFFKLNTNAFTAGLVSPLNSGWYTAIPNNRAFLRMRERAVWRLQRDWDEELGWGDRIPSSLTYRGGKRVARWEFNGADMDQGLLTHYFLINHGNAVLIDTSLYSAKRFERGLKHEPAKKISLKAAVPSCGGRLPTSFFAHFTGRKKPWMVGEKTLHRSKANSDIAKWARHLDALRLPVNSSNILSLGLGSPLGFFNKDFPKGGFKHPDTSRGTGNMRN